MFNSQLMWTRSRLLSFVFKTLWCLLSVFLVFCENLPPKMQIVPQKQGKSYSYPPKPKRAGNVLQ
jgi:hypothetical protein